MHDYFQTKAAISKLRRHFGQSFGAAVAQAPGQSAKEVEDAVAKVGNNAESVTKELETKQG
jgi:hypothetical protein